ncbi:MAG: choice-of-anchor tandem repeat GloVer-containing protein, partial [Terriglobia bacterium]
MPFRKVGIYGPWVLTIVLLIVATGVPVARAQTYTDLYNFDGTHGANPLYPQVLAQGRDGNLYGTTLYGGTQDAGVVFRITPSGSLTVLYNFDDGVHGGYSFSGLTLGTDGNFYGTTNDGGTGGGFGTIFNITPSGSLTTLYSFTGGQTVLSLWRHQSRARTGISTARQALALPTRSARQGSLPFSA